MGLRRLRFWMTSGRLILCDINMPVLDGIEFIKQLPAVENEKDAPVVMITTEGSESHVMEALSWGARGYIRKPFTAEQVKEHVIPVLGENHETVNDVLAAHKGHEAWVPLLEMAAREVFGLMLGSISNYTPPRRPCLKITAMVGLAGQLCGV